MTTFYGLIGCGMMGREHLHNIALLEDAVVSVIYEPNKEMAQAASTLAPKAVFVESLEGSYSNVVGLPIVETCKIFKEKNIGYWLNQ